MVDQLLEFLFSLIIGLFSFLLRIAIAIETFARHNLHAAGVNDQITSMMLVVLAIMIIFTAYRMFGGVFGILITAFLILFATHVMMPDLLDGLRHG